MQIKFKNFTITSSTIAFVYSIVMVLTALSLVIFNIMFDDKTSNFFIIGILLLAFNSKKIFKMPEESK